MSCPANTLTNLRVLLAVGCVRHSGLDPGSSSRGARHQGGDRRSPLLVLSVAQRSRRTPCRQPKYPRIFISVFAGHDTRLGFTAIWRNGHGRDLGSGFASGDSRAAANDSRDRDPQPSGDSVVGAVIWPFKRTEQRSDDYTVQVVDRIETEALAGVSADALAVCEASIGLWERALSSATVTPDSRPLRAVTGPVLALAGRALASRGEAIFRIDVDGGVVSLVPASAWDIQGSATTWRYRCDFIGPSGSTTMALPAEAVVHFRTGVDTRTPWRGQSPVAAFGGDGAACRADRVRVVPGNADTARAAGRGAAKSFA